MSDLFDAGIAPKPLHDDQAAALHELNTRIAAGARRIVLQGATGWGKTLLGAALVKSAIDRGERVLWVVPAIALVDQTISVFNRQGISDIGVLQAQHHMTHWGMPCQVASVQTLMRRTAPPASLIVIDECHKWFNYYRVMMGGEEWKNVPIVGLSATPWSKGLGRYYTDLIIAGTTADMIERGRLSDFKVYAPHTPDLRGVRTIGGDYAEIDLAGVMNEKAITADIVQTWQRLGSGLPTLVFAVDRAHAKAIQTQFQAAGIPCGYQDAFTSDSERAGIERQFREHILQVVCSVGTLTTGVDWDVRCIILARPTKSEILFTQIIGRGLRLANGKDHCLILDHSSTHERLGFVTDIHHDRLNDGREKLSSKPDPMKLPKVCPKCKFVKPPKVSLCPVCGFKAVAVPAVVSRAGELRELKRGARYQQWASDRMAIAGQLKSIEIARKYRAGWARQYYVALYEAPPPASVVISEPCPEVLSWIKSKMIRYAKSKKHFQNMKRPQSPIASGSLIGAGGE